ncbi:hypothetical protein KY316_00275 [Candidatus Woesearchaeota archaeon]|nr:hypothetical protein [Candidatus Woesearchaeota archaeon]
MDNEDDYEILPREQIKKLKDEISRLKSGKAMGDGELLYAIKELSVKLESMSGIFEAAEIDLREEDKTAEIVKDKIDPILERVNLIAEQNQKIAKGLVAINDILEEKLKELVDLTEDIKAMRMEAPAPQAAPAAPSIPPELGIGSGSVPPPPVGEGPTKLPFRKKKLFG